MQKNKYWVQSPTKLMLPIYIRIVPFSLNKKTPGQVGITLNQINQKDETTVTYYMNMLQNLDMPKNICVSLNMGEHIDPKKILKKLYTIIPYSHPMQSWHRKGTKKLMG